jgi:alpha-L-fucosidase 2
MVALRHMYPLSSQSSLRFPAVGGAWLALHLWDYLSYHDDTAFLLDSFLPTFRDLAQFFECYMFLGPDGAMHTGPTTSPENSFCGKLPEQGRVF